VDISPDGTELLILSGEGSKDEEPYGGTLWILPVAGGSARPVGSVIATDALWGEKAESIVFCDGHELNVVSRDGSNRRKLLTISGYVESLRWSANRQVLRFTVTKRDKGGTSTIWEMSANGMGLREVIPGLPGSAACCGTWMAGSDDFLFQWTRAGRTDLWELPGNHRDPRESPIRLTAGPMNYLSGISAEGIEVSRDGQWVAYTLFPEGTLWRSNLNGSERVQLTFSPMRAFLPRWSPDGTQIAFNGTASGNHWTTYVIPAQGGVARQLISGNEETADATWMPDNNSIVFGPWNGGGSRGIKVLDMNTNRVSPLPDSEEMWSPRTSPDGRYIAALSQQESKMMLFDTRTQKWEELSEHYSGYPSWSRDGGYLYFQDWNRGTGYPSRVLRIRMRDRKVETAVDLKSLDRLSIGTFMSWSGLAADDSVLLSRNNSTQEIYAVKW
jgi:Tol biopolymer transport system component